MRWLPEGAVGLVAAVALALAGALALVTPSPAVAQAEDAGPAGAGASQGQPGTPSPGTVRGFQPGRPASPGLGGADGCAAQTVPGPGAGGLALTWDGPAVALDWRGQAYDACAQGSFTGDAVAVPGDHLVRTARVRNAGPSDAVALVTIEDARVTAPGGAVNTDLADALLLVWDIGGVTGALPWSQAVASQPVATVQLSLPRGAQIPVSAGYDFPLQATGGRHHGQPSSQLSFTVRVQLQGLAHADGSGTPTTPPSPAGGPGTPTGGSTVWPFPGAGVSAPWLLAAAATAWTGAYGTVRLAAARRRPARCPGAGQATAPHQARGRARGRGDAHAV